MNFRCSGCGSEKELINCPNCNSFVCTPCAKRNAMTCPCCKRRIEYNC